MSRRGREGDSQSLLLAKQQLLAAQLAAKANKAATPTAGHIAALDSSGNPVDGGLALTDKANQIDLEYLRNRIYNDFLVTTNPTGAWHTAAVNGGSPAYAGGLANHQGVYQHTAAVAANSGSRVYTEPNSIVLTGSEKTTIIFKTVILANVLRRMGFHTSTDQTAPTDGVYCKIDGGVLTGQTANNGTGSTTGTSYNLGATTWYRLSIELNSTATLATFTLYADNSTTVLWTDTLSTNIPVSRLVSHVDICTSTAGSAVSIGLLDYMDIVFAGNRSQYASSLASYNANLEAIISSIKPPFSGKRGLVMGDSTTYYGTWHTAMASVQECTYAIRALGGIEFVPLLDGYDTLAALSTADVTGIDFIVILAGINEYGRLKGSVGDLYPTQDTVAGRLQYLLNGVYAALTTAGNLTCKILVVAPYCYGPDSTYTIAGDQENPSGSGQTFGDICDTICAVAKRNHIHSLNLWEQSGIGRNTWPVYGSSAGDRVHLNAAGYARIGYQIGVEMNRL